MRLRGITLMVPWSIASGAEPIMETLKNRIEALYGMLASLPATAANLQARKPLLCEMDDILSTACSELDASLGDYYRECCRRVAGEIRVWHGDTARIWKLYSSAIIIKDCSGKVIGFDVNDGCTPEAGRRTRLRIDRATAEALAEVIDVMFYTHAHLDHVGTIMADALMAHGTIVVAPQDAIDKWTLDTAIPAEICHMDDVHCYAGHQGFTLPNFAYAVKLACGKTVFVRGDMYSGEELVPVLDTMQNTGVTPDLACLSHYKDSGPDPVPEIYGRFKCDMIPIHEWEFTHRKLGQTGVATQSYHDLHDFFAVPIADGKCHIITWGESLDFPMGE